MRELDLCSFSKVLPLYTDSDYHMPLLAAAESKARARVWVDSPAEPCVTAACFGVRIYIGGSSSNESNRNAIRSFFNNVVLSNQIERMRHFFMVFWDEPGWKDVLLDILSVFIPVLREREYYCFDTARNFKPVLLPEGYEYRWVNEGFLNERDWGCREILKYEMCSERVSVEDFLKQSYGVCAVSGNEIAGWCLSEYNNSTGCEVGIEVLEDHQRKGVATALASALVNESRKRGLRCVGWDSFRDNIPSTATACKAGFVKYMDFETIIVQR